MPSPCVYILASKPKGTLYVCVTSGLIRRVWEHKQGLVEGFTKRYAVKTLVYAEPHETMAEAIKKWRRAWKLQLISRGNPTWRDLYWGMASVAPPVGSLLSRG